MTPCAFAAIFIESSKTYKLFLDKQSEIVSPEKTFKLMTIDAAKSLGINSKVGNLEPNKNADFVVIDNINLNYLHTVERLVSKLIYTTSKFDIKHTFIGGKRMF